MYKISESVIFDVFLKNAAINIQARILILNPPGFL